ncbi:MCR_0457 family protein [Acinetobacter silvestris]|uniref:DUF7944 domain-containing protein n=1 Tax=Acinetobacter silvestris TaxID=1977882 RepID=A0A1Y3CFJ8_9GAMM|nr:hypothetical protein [Acinetobacter silvestris]OTG65881.1 hypothetical protein B9T28_06685 [Acinetobacter silvestris]
MSTRSLNRILCLSLFILSAHSAFAESLTTAESDSLVKEDIASAQVLATVCPKILGKNAILEKKMQQLSESYLKNMSVKSTTLAQLAQDSEYQAILAAAFADAAEVDQDEQKSVCGEILEIND